MVGSSRAGTRKGKGERTGERLDDESRLHAADLARHRAAYRFAARLFHSRRSLDPLGSIGSSLPGGPPDRPCAASAADGEGPLLDLGCGTGYGAALLAEDGGLVVALDRAAPRRVRVRGGARDGAHGGARDGAHGGARDGAQGGACDGDAGAERDPAFVAGELARLPFASARFAGVASLQVIEHLSDPAAYLAEIARVLRPDGVALFTTPNRLQSDGENPFHLREYTPDELAALLARHFEQVTLLGLHAVAAAARFQAARLRRIRWLTRLDPLRLRRRLPAGLVEWLFGRLARGVRLTMGEGVRSSVGEGHFPIGGPADRDCLDLVAIVAGPRSSGPGAPPTSR